jgi:hypothetical protein
MGADVRSVRLRADPGGDQCSDDATDADGAGHDPGDVSVHGAEQLEGKEADARTDIFAFGTFDF